MKDLSGKIKSLRISQGLSQAKMAAKIGISQAAYGKIESGFTKSISIEVGIGIAKALNENFGQLFELEGYDFAPAQREALIETLIDSEKFLDEKVKTLEKQIEDKDLLIRMFQNEKVRISSDIMRFLEETYDMQIDFLDRYSSLSTFQKKEIQNTILSIMNTVATSRFVSTGLISKSELDKIIPKYIGIVHPADPEEKE